MSRDVSNDAARGPAYLGALPAALAAVSPAANDDRSPVASRGNMTKLGSMTLLAGRVTGMFPRVKSSRGLGAIGRPLGGRSLDEISLSYSVSPCVCRMGCRRT